jgi:hypothetical protein
MRQFSLVACLIGLVVAWIVPASAMPVAKPNDLGVSSGTVLVHGHGHHYGWGRGRGHHYGWRHGHHHGW